jgi:hypothetical protein
VTLSLEDVSTETETSIEEDDKFAELSRGELEEFVAILSLLLAGGSSAGPELLESSISMGSSQIVSPSPQATSTPATANAMAILAMKDADVCRAVLMRMGTS